MVDGLLLLTSPASPYFPYSHPREADFYLMTSAKTNPPASLKRTYTLVSRSNPSSPSEQQDNNNPFKVPTLSPSRHSPRHMSLSLKRRYPFCKSPTAPSIITNTATQSSAVPSFVSIFDIDVDMSGCPPTSLHSQHAIFQKGPTSMVEDSIDPLQHSQTGSISTSASSSTNSSPTTTISTLGSTITEDHTPDSSPDSLVSAMPLSSFRSKKPSIPSSEDLTIVPPSPLPGYTRSLSPSKKPRNTKNLSLKPLSVTTSPVQAVCEKTANTVNQSPRSMSAPTSPAFIKPPPPPQNPRRRPSNLGLTIKLPGALPEKTAVQGQVLPAGGITALRHHQSSPSLFSPAHGIPGGMKLPPTPGFQRPSRLFSPPRPSLTTFTTQDSLSSSLSSSSISNSPPKSPDILHEMEEEDEEPRSGEAKSPAYPSGPVCIFEPNIYLYAEPDAELASKFDVIVNVAREVVNPFKAVSARGPVSAMFDGFESDYMPPDTACTEASFTTAFEEALFSPKTGKLRPNEPEYVHMLWDHNTPILDDLPHLVNLIDERASAGKKVLVHCQCGVSRSATLLIAYSMFKNPEKSMQDAYSAVKAKSRWIGPNMSLIYQLTDWKKKIQNDGVRPGGGGWRMGNQSSAGVRGLVKGGARNGFGRAGTMDEESMTESMPEPQTAPLPEMRKTPSPPPLNSDKLRTRDHPIPQMVRTRSENGGFISGVSPGPSSAPPGMVSIPGTESGPSNMRQSWPDSESIEEARGISESPRAGSPPPSWATAAGERVKEDIIGFVPPPLPPSAAYFVQRAEKAIFGRPVDNDDDNPPPTPSFMSPRNSGYFGAPIRRSGGFFFADPRSPTQRGGEPPIVRSIFDVL